VPMEVRRWEKAAHLKDNTGDRNGGGSDVRIGDYVELDRPAGLQGRELEAEQKKDFQPPFREQRSPPSNIGWTHAWGLMNWGKKAGSWGQGVDGLKDRKKE